MWLYKDCDALNDGGREKIVFYLQGKYTQEDVDEESEDIVLKKVELDEGKVKVVKKTVFRMLFAEKRWKKITITKRVKSSS